MVPVGELVVIGAGANIAQERSELPVETATSLALCGAGEVCREDLIVSYLGELADLHRVWSAGGAGLAALRTAYRSSCLTIGLEVDVHQPDGRVARGAATGSTTWDGWWLRLAARAGSTQPATWCTYAARSRGQGTRHDRRHGRPGAAPKRVQLRWRAPVAIAPVTPCLLY